MEIVYSVTPLEGILRRDKIRSINCVYLDRNEYFDWKAEAITKKILGETEDYWFTVVDYNIKFYLEDE